MNVLSEIKRTISNWWVFLVLGILLIAGGIYVFQTPEESYITLSVFFAILILLDGISAIVFALSNTNMDGWGWQLANGILSTFIGVVLFVHPALTMSILPLFVGFWIIMKGGMVVGVSFDLKKVNQSGWGWMLFLGLINILFGIAIIANPIIGVSFILFITAFAFISMGISFIVLSMKLRSLKSKIKDLKENASDRFEELKNKIKKFADENADDPKETLKKIKDMIN